MKIFRNKNKKYKMTENSLEGFKSVQLKYKAEAEHGHQILFKPHAVRVMEPSKPADRDID